MPKKDTISEDAGSEDLVVRAKRRIAHLLSYKAMLQPAVIRVLQEEGFADEVIETAMLSMQPYFDDEELIEQKLRRWEREGRSLVDVRVRLKKIGFVGDVHYNEREALNNLIKKKYKTAGHKVIDRKAMQAILRRGFPAELLYSHLKEDVV